MRDEKEYSGRPEYSFIRISTMSIFIILRLAQDDFGNEEVL